MESKIIMDIGRHRECRKESRGTTARHKTEELQADETSAQVSSSKITSAL